MFKKLISILMILTLLCTAVVPGFANEKEKFKTVNGIKVKILVDNDDFRVVRTTEDKIINEVTFNKNSSELSVKIIDKKSKEILYNSESAVKTSATVAENTFVNYQYERNIGTDEWLLERPNTPYISKYYFRTYKTPENEDYLSNFQDAVEDVNFYEWSLIGSLGMSVLTSIGVAVTGIANAFTAGILTPAQIAALAAAIGAYGATATALHFYIHSMEDAYEAYWDTYFNSTVFF